MRIDVLGPLRVSDGAHTIAISRPKERALLAALATEAGSVVSIDRLVTHLWGDEPPPAAIGSLHAYVSNLRRLLEPGRPPRAPSTVLISRAPGYLLAVEPTDIDAVRFEQMTAAAREMLAGGDASAAAATLDEALALWRGPAFADFPYDDFAQPAIRRLDELRAAATEDRADALLSLGRHDEVIADAEAMLAIDPLRERVWAQLVVALYRAGRQADALTAYRRARAALDEIGLEPGPALRRLEQSVLEQSPDLDTPPTPARPVLHTPDPSSTRSAIVGRSGALSTCREVIADVAGGAGRVLVVSGEPGIGKTALADALLDQARDAGMRTAVARCPEGGGAPALWPWMQLLRQLDVEATDDRIAPLLTDADESAVVGSRRLFAGVLDVVRSVTGDGPLALLIDDVQWADEVSHALLQLAIVDLVDAPVLLVMTLRDPCDEKSRSFDDTRSTLARASHAQHVALGGLDVAELAALVQALDVTADADAVAALHRRTAGNPFFATQLVGLLSTTTGGLDEHEVRAAALPTGVRDVVRRRLARFPDDANAVLAVAAIAGPEVSLGVLERVAGTDEEQLLQILDLLTAAGLLVEAAELPGVYRFGHDLVRDAIADALPGIRRARLHQRIADALVHVYGEQDRRLAHDLARHSVAARSIAGAAPAIRRLLWSSRIALIDLALELSERQLTAALTLLDEVPEADERDALEVQVQSRLGQVLFHKPDRRGEANVRNQQALRLCRPDDPEQLGGVLLGIGCYAPLAGEFAECLRAGRQLLDLALATGHEQLESAAHYVLSMQAFTGDVQAARHHIDRAVAMCADTAERNTPPMWVAVPQPTQRGVRALILALDDDDEFAVTALTAVDEARRWRNSWAMSWAAAFAALGAVVRADVETLDRILVSARESGAGIEHCDAVLDACSTWRGVVSGRTSPVAAAHALDDDVARLQAVGDGMFHVPVQAMAIDLLEGAGSSEDVEARRDRVESDARALGHRTWLRRLATSAVR